MAIHVERVENPQGDVLHVHGHDDTYVDDSGVPYQLVGHGWVSAMTNHYGADAYDAQGQLVEGATPREMTDDERHAYWESLLAATAPPIEKTQPTVLYEAPKPEGTP